jgi:predicted ATPase/signal transduction histidine kinase
MVSAQVSISGYQIGEQLYNGSRTLVYRAVRTDSLPVVIKLLKNPYPNFTELVQFRNQYAIAKNLNLLGIIQTYSLETYQNGYALVMEDFGGISLSEWTRHQETERWGVEFLQIAISLCNILDLLYRHGVIHKDIKPANILINPETKQVKLIDFSIASLLPRETQTLVNPNVLEGTLAYLSPEQTGRMNRGIDYRTDFYSLGVTFFELLTGKLPFLSDDPRELIYCHIAKHPPAIHEINPEISPVLSEIVNKLMAKNAEERYQSALGLKFDLEKCLTQLQQIGEIKYFEIGKRDLCDRFLISEKLYGRKTEVQQLLAAFERVADGNSETMLIAGFSGIGKTAVVNEVHKPIVKQHGYFIKGKFDQFNRNIPFSAFVQAFRNLMMQLLSLSDQQLQQWKTKILATVGENGQVIIEVIPELEKIIGQQPPALELSGTAAQNRFNLLFQKFIQLFTTEEHPLVMFLDDLQWADSGSLKLMQLLMSESHGKYLLLIGAYRDNEVSVVHPLMFTLGEIRKTNATINTIILNPLSNKSLNQLVADTLSCRSEIAQPLTELVYQKTQGNPFFSTQFLKALYEDGLIKFDLDEGNWQCNIAEVRALTLSNDVVEFMALQLQKLPTPTQDVLKLAACIGNQFDLATLAIVSAQSEIETAASLWKALQEGLILPQSEIYKFYIGQEIKAFVSNNSEIVGYKFSHDRVQQAAYSLIPENLKNPTHYQIGQLLLQQTDIEATNNIFELVNQLNYGTSLITQQTERDELAQLNLIACRKAKAAIAYQAAREYAAVGLSLVGQSWFQYKMTLALHELAAEIACLCGDFEMMEHFIKIIIAQTHSLLEQLNVYRIRIQSYFSQNQLALAIATGQQILQQLGVTLSALPTLTDIQQEIQDIDELIGDKKIEDFVHLGAMTERSKLAIIQIANSIMPAAHMSGSPLFPLLIFLSVKLSLQHGNTSATAVSYVYYGVILCNKKKDVNKAMQFGQLALKVVSKLNTKATKPEVLLVLGLFILHRTFHIKETLPLSQEGYQAALEVGNQEFAGYNAHAFCYNSFWCGQPLATLEEQTRAYCDRLLQLNQLITANYCRIHWQSILNLLGLAEHPHILSGEALQETELLPLLLSAKNRPGLYLFYFYKLMLSFLFGDEQAQNYAFECRRYLMDGVGGVGEPVLYFYDSLIALSQLSQSDEATEILQRVTQNQTQLQQHWAYHAPMNHQHKVDLVEAEKYRVLGKNYEAGDWYDRAIAGAKENEYIQEEALANELAAKFYLGWGKQKVAAGYMQEAYYCYARWGAKAKTDDLEKRYPDLLRPILQPATQVLASLESIVSQTYSIHSSSNYHSHSSTGINSTLDFVTLIQASQSISSSIKLDDLIQSLTQIVLKNSGADKCVLLLCQDDVWHVRAIATLDGATLQATPLENNLLVPSKLIQYVKRTQESVVIDDLKTDLPVIGDYLNLYQPQSVLCLPILKQGQLFGILYLENRLTSKVFTSNRISILYFLCTQAAISLENARLYAQEQQRSREISQKEAAIIQKSQELEQALQELQQAQLQMVQNEKMASLGNLVSGVAHEVNNPIGFLKGSINNAEEYVLDLIGHLILYHQHYPQAAKPIQAHAEDIDLEFIIEDLPKLLNAMTGATNRIQSISTSLRTFSRADTDYKVKANLHEGLDSTLLILKYRIKANENRPAINIHQEYGSLPEIECFPGQLNQVFMNILANAIDVFDEMAQTRTFAELQANPQLITIGTEVFLSQAYVRIRDNGKGMSAEVKKRIFDNLFTTKGVGKGTGLGLAIAKSIVEETHNGKLTCNSVAGKGTEFIMQIPV